MAYEKEMFIKVVTGKAGKEYPCTICGTLILKGEKYTKVNSTNKYNPTGAVKKKVITACKDHDIKASLDAVDV